MDLKATIKEGIDALLDIIYPPNISCPLCNNKIYDRKIREEGSFYLCDPCFNKLPFIKPPTCVKCGKHLVGLPQEADSMCSDCTKGNHAFYKGTSILEYNTSVLELIHRYKYRGERDLAGSMIYWMSKALKEKPWSIHGIVPVPLHPIRKRQRGFNQAELLAKGISQNLNIPFMGDKLIRIKNTPKQSKLGRAERLKNLEGAFMVIPSSKKIDPLNNKNLLLVDDVYTTGSTVHRCARTLIDAGAHRVYVITLAMGLGY